MRKSLPALALAGAVALAGCSKTLDTDKAEREIEKGLKAQLNVTAKVSCPDDVEAKKGDKFRCKAKAEGQTADVDVTQQDDEGNVRWRLERK